MEKIKLSLHKFWKKLVTIIIAITLLLVGIPILFPPTPSTGIVQTRYMRSDNQTINGLFAYKLETTNTASSTLATGSASGNLVVYWGIRVWKRVSAGTETEITAGTPVAQVSKGTTIIDDVPTVKSNTWVCPNTTLTPTDSVVLRQYTKFGTGAWTAKSTFTTQQLGATELANTTWTVYYYTFRDYDGGTTYGDFFFDSSGYPSRITNFACGDTLTYSDVGASTALAWQSCLFYAKWTANVALSGFIFGTNNTSAWQNDTWTSFTTNPDWSNVTKRLNGNATKVNWQIYANNTSNYWNTTGLQTITILTTQNFGYETLGAYHAIIDNTLQGSVFTVPYSGKAENITVGLQWYPISSWSGNVTCGVYLHDDLSFLGVTEEKTLALTNTATWYTFDFEGNPIFTTNTNYILIVWGEDAVNQAYIVFNDGTTDQGHNQTATYDGFPDPLVPTHNTNKFSIYCTYTLSSPPSLTLNTAGNPNETSFGTDTDNRMYRNGSLNREDWIYINITNYEINPTLEWKNETQWKNYTMTSQAGTDFCYINMTQQPQYSSYTFNIYTENEISQEWSKWIWKYWDYESAWGTEEEWRKYAGLNYTTSTNLTYSSYQLFNFTYANNQKNDRCFPHEQPSDSGLEDIGYLDSKFQQENYTTYCGSFVGYLFNKNVTINETFTIQNIYLHIWWSNSDPDTNSNFRVGTQDTSLYNCSNIPESQWLYVNTTTSVGSYNFTFGMQDIYYLTATYWDIPDMTYTDNNISLFSLTYYAWNLWPSIDSASTPYLLSFVIFNLPSNATLQSMDSDYDGISDYNELYVNYTYPFTGATPTDLSVGWNNFKPWDIDIDKTLGQVNASLNFDNISWSVITVDYGNGTQWSLVYGQTYNNDKVIISTSDTLWIYCDVAGEWGHIYP